MEVDPQAMSVDECRAWLAKDEGWELRDGIWFRHDKGFFDLVDLFPANLDGAASSMPDGWWLSLEHVVDQPGEPYWSAMATRNTEYRQANGPDEITARYRLAVACRLADREGK